MASNLTAAGRSEVLRITLSDEAWRYFETLRDVVRRDNPKADVSPGDRGTRLVLRAWIEMEIRTAVVSLDTKGGKL